MDTYEPLKAEIYAACLQAAHSLGPGIKKLSWFGRNAKSLPVTMTRPPSRSLATESVAKAA